MRLPTRRERHFIVMASLLIAATLLPGVCGEKVTVGSGFGWDGQIYGRLAQRFHDEVVEKPINSYRVQRMLPSAFVHLGLRLTGQTPDDTSVILGFVLLNVLMLVCALALWERIAHSMGISLRGCWLGFVGLFLNFAVLKQASYYPVLTDLSAFTLGLLVFFAYLCDRPVLLFAATLAGGFTWPVAAYSGAVMLVLPRRPVPRREKGPSPLATCAAFGSAAVLLAAIIFLFWYRGRIRAGAETAPVIGALAPLSIALACVYIFVVTRGLLASVDPTVMREALRTLAPARLVLALAAGGTVIAVVRTLADGSRGPTVLSLLGLVSIGSITKPLAFLVPHVVYFGPIVLVIILYWEDFCRVTDEYGLGVILVCLMTIVIAMTSESRWAMFGFPMMVSLVVRVTEAASWRPMHYWILAVVAVLYSKVWLTINLAPMEGSFLDFPFQMYFMQHGPWMSNTTYAIHAVVVIATGVALFMELPGVRRVGTPAEAG